MSKAASSHRIALLIILLIFSGIGWLVFERLAELNQEKPDNKTRDDRVVPVQVAAVAQQSIALERSFTGSVEAYAEFIVAPKIAGRVEQLNVDVADSVKRGQIIASLDNDEYIQELKQAEAELVVAEANLLEAQNLLTIADRALLRVDQLSDRGISSESQRDTARAEQLAQQAHLQVTQAQLVQAKAALESARIRLGYTEVNANWRGGNNLRTVAERYVDEGETVTSNAPLLRIVELNPIKITVYTSEQDYALFKPGQKALLTSDAYPDQSFEAELLRISPVFNVQTRQAKIEFSAPNDQLLLKPGMFVQLKVILNNIPQATVVPQQAIVRREDQNGVYLVTEQRNKVLWQAVKTGIKQGQRVQITSPPISGEVVVLGQQLLEDGAAILIVTDKQREAQ